MIIIKLKGGLGNQLFQYAAARSLAHIHKTTVKLDTTNYYYGEPRQYELCHFNIQENLAQKLEIHKLTKVKQNKFQKIVHTLLHNHPPLSPHHIRYNKSELYKNFFNLPDNIYLDGYFQSEKYFLNIAHIIRNEFTVKNEMSDKNKKITEMMQNVSSVNLHIRRGDYVSDAKANQKHGVCSLDYYHSCIEHIGKKIKDPHFFVFSNDITWSRNNLKINCNDVTYVDYNKPNEAYEDLRLMSFCKHHITANSTFSWWGAWLAFYKDKMVFVPKKWFAKEKDTEGMLPDSWIKI